MLTHDTTSIRETYAELCADVLREGRAVSPRGQDTVEVAPALIRLTDPLDSLPTGTGRGVVTGLAAVEALSLIAGEADPRLFVTASPRYASFVDPGTGELEVAYGPRVGLQMEHAEQRLRSDPSSRQAHVDFWREHDYPGLRAYPCVVSCGFTVRDGRLDQFVEMRSNDLWLGFPYDAFTFCQLQATLANVLGVGLGHYLHYARSLHLYAKDMDPATKLTPAPRAGWSPRFAGVGGGSWVEAQQRARLLLRGVELTSMTESETAYFDSMRAVIAKMPRV